MRKVSARKTTVRPLNLVEAQEFVKLNHRQGATKAPGRSLALGLYLADDLLAVIIFCSPRTAGMKRKYSSELLRLAFESNTRVIGGASKLISYYIKNFSPTDFFTYQDTAGEATAVYEHAGMKYVSQAKKKQYLVAPGKTRATAQKKECYSIASVAMRGPDALLGTTLGEVFRENGKRKTNPELFIEELGWHIEETTGDRVYEWVDPNRTYYTYKITASDSDKYYYGVSHVKKANASREDCLNDGYMGSGGKHAKNKFSNWQKAHLTTQLKEIVKLHPSAREAFEYEEKLIGTSHLTDKLCLNSTAGGKDGGLRLQLSIASRGLTHCPKHGESKHQGDSCYRCSAESRYGVGKCEVHPESKHTKNGCLACALNKSLSESFCEFHGKTLYKGSSCVKCSNQKNVAKKLCEDHGLEKHIGDQCYRCIAERKVGYSIRHCSEHGETTFRGGSCAKCSSKSGWTLGFCSKHKDAKIRGGKCQSCINENTLRAMICEDHGEVKTQNGKCPRCEAKKNFTKELCEDHGLASFRKGKCIACEVRSKQRVKHCEIHGDAIHQGNSCCRCIAEKASHTRDHLKKGVLKDTCRFCSLKMNS